MDLVLLLSLAAIRAKAVLPPIKAFLNTEIVSTQSGAYEEPCALWAPSTITRLARSSRCMRLRGHVILVDVATLSGYCGYIGDV
jgi:hypothetical protein